MSCMQANLGAGTVQSIVPRLLPASTHSSQAIKPKASMTHRRRVTSPSSRFFARGSTTTAIGECSKLSRREALVAPSVAVSNCFARLMLVWCAPRISSLKCERPTICASSVMSLRGNFVGVM